ncbi:MAG: alpha/beta hydrolase [Clostridia bacterium]|nr:alpha/beta hydrolase [Clostridia bacterium]
MKKGIKIFIAVLAAVIVITAVAAAVYVIDFYHAKGVAEYMESGGGVAVSEITNKNINAKFGAYLFDGPGETDALIFYPGAKVEETAYAPLMRAVAEGGVDCFLVKMPLHLAFFGANIADLIIADRSLTEDGYEHYWLAGHSLGGAMAANHAAELPGIYSGLFLLASYPTEDLSRAHIPVTFICGENDGVINRDKLEAGLSLAPDHEYVEIRGGNHAGFGSYGRQRGDGSADIAAEEQWSVTAEEILKRTEGMRTR